MTIVDACNPSRFDRALLEECRAAGVTALNISLDMWGDSRRTMTGISAWYRLVSENQGICQLVTTPEELRSADETGKVGIILGIQNTSPLDGDLGYVEIFNRLGLKVMLLTYNNQNLVGAGCYEDHDSGLSRFGRKVVAEMNRVGMVVDLAHCGRETTLQAISVSSRPVTITHANPTWIFPSKRSKSKEELTALRDSGGMLGLTMFPTMIGGETTPLEGFLDMVRRTVDFMGIDQVGFGSDLILNQDDAFLNHARMGTWTHEVDYGTGQKGGPVRPPWPEWFQTVKDFQNIQTGLVGAGFTDDEADKIMGGNWKRFFECGFAPE